MITPRPEAETAEVKEQFRIRYQSLLGERYDEFLKYSLAYIKKSIRVNTLKADVSDVRHRLEMQGFRMQEIPWCREGFKVKGERTDLGNLDEHFLGYFYVQEAASMMPAEVLQPEPGELVLDMCASPGSKTTQMAAMMENSGLLIANDVTGIRMKPLGLNLQRNGIFNVVSTLMRGQQFGRLDAKFDRVLVDAPCSGTGTIRRNPETLKIWNPGMIKRLSRTQKTLIESGFKALKTGGRLVYSTCSLEPEEDEEVVDSLLKRHPDAVIEKIPLEVKKSAAVLEFEGKKYSEDVGECLRVWPQDNDTEGFFVARIRKASP